MIYHLNKRSEDLEFDLREAVDQHSRELAATEQQAQDSLAALEARTAEEAQAASQQHKAALQVGDMLDELQ